MLHRLDEVSGHGVEAGIVLVLEADVFHSETQFVGGYLTIAGLRVLPPICPAAEDGDGTPLTAPMPGMIVGLEKQEGDQVNEGETVMVLEAMKMENGLPAPTSGTISKISFGVGDHVKKNDVLCIII